MKYLIFSLRFVSLFAILLTSNRVFAQNTLDNLGLTAATPSAIALSTRLLSTSYTGPAFRIRRSSDNELRDLYFDAGTISLNSQVSVAGGGPATLTTLGTWIGANSGTVAIWYDQSGNGRNAVQATNARQPRLINAGSIDLKSGRAAVRHLAAGQHFLSVSTAILSTNFWSINAVESLDGGANQRMLSGQGNWLLGFWNGNEQSFYFQGGAAGTYNSGIAATTNNQIYSSIGQGASNALVFRNSSSFSAQGGGVPSSPPTTLLTSSYITTSEFSNGTIQEITVFSNAITAAERQIIECNQGTHYSISISTPSISLNATSPIPVGTTTVNLPYSAANGSTYSITWNPAAITAGFVNVTNAALPASPITITVPAVGPVAGSSYNGTLTVSNSCSGISPNYSVTIFIIGTNTLDNLGLTVANPSSVAYGLRKLSSTYVGPVMQIRRSSDGELRDVYFDGTGVLSINSLVSAAGGGDATATTLTSWIGANSGTVAIWYDQSGQWRNASQTLVANQPRVINAGAIETQNGKPAVFLNGTSSYLVESTTNVSNPYAMNTVASRTASNGGYQRLINLSSTSDFFGYLGASVGNYATFVGSGGSWNDVAANTPNTSIGATSAILSMNVVAGAGGLVPFINGITQIGKNGTAGTSTGFLIGAPFPPAFSLSQLWTGYISDFEIFPATLSIAARGALECNQSSFYSISFTTPTITHGSITPVPVGTGAVNLTYSATTGNPTTYSISWDASALGAGFTNIANSALPATPISIAVGPTSVPGATYTGVLTVNNACGTSSINYPISVSILNSILGLTPATSASYSLRKLSPTYTGAAIQVRRSSDNATQDIGFTAGGDLDQTALLAFVGAGNGFVSIWYDQSGFGRNATQATQAAQPRIVNAGVVDTQNGKPTMIFSGAQTLLSSMTAVQGTTSGTVTTSNFVFQNATVQSSLLSNGDGGANRYNIHAPWNDGNTYFDIGNNGSGGRISGPLTWPSYSIATFRRNGAQGDVWKNGVNSLTSGSFGTAVTSNSAMWIGSYNGASFFINGGMAELTVFSSALSNADRTTLECSQSAYYTISLTGATNFEFYIQGTPAASACNTTDEQVVWKNSDLVNNQATGNNLLKVQGGGAWNGGAASWNTVSNNGYFQFTASETNTFRMAGLSTTNTDANYTTIQYAFYLQNGGTLGIYESGVNRGNFGSYATNDILKITVEANVVKYYRNATLLYISTVTPTLPLLVDVSVNTVGGTINNAIVSNYNTGVFVANAINAGATPVYQWKLNGSDVGTNNSTYTNTTLNNNDIVSCVLTYTGICGVVTATSNGMTNKAVAAPSSIDFYITGTTAASACNTVDENVAWKITDFRNVQGTGNSLVKINADGSNGGWNGGAASWNIVANNGYFQFTASETNTFRMAGLSTTNTDANYTTIQYAFYLVNNGTLRIYQSGVDIGAFGTYTTNDILKIAVEANVVKYYRNATLLYISAVAPTLPLLVDVSINSTGGTINNAIVSNYNTGTFTATATNAGTPSFQWFVNGSPIGGATLSTYTNTSLANNDVVTCTMLPGLGGCTLVPPYTSNAITNKAVPAPTSIDFYITGTVAASACNTVDENVAWKITDFRNVQGTGNSLVKINADGSNGGWNGGAASWNTVSNNGYFQFTATETNTLRMVGLSNTNTDANYTTIQYAFYLLNNGTVRIFQSGVDIGAFGTYTTNDIFKIAVEANVVKYYRNATLLYISAIAPSLPLLVDVSINSTGGTITNAIVSNYNTGTFTATATNAGTPSFQWFLNGSPIGGATSSSYTNTSLANNDIVTCTMLPGLGGCTLVPPYTSNTITNKAVPAPTSIDFYLSGTISTTACTEAIEQVVWKISDLVNTQASGNNLVKINASGWNGGAASWNTVSNNGFFEFTATETNIERMAGLSTTNVNASYTTIQYAVYLVNNGTYRVYESNNDRGGFGTYSTNDVFRVSVEANVVKYFRNGVLFYTSAVAPTLPLLVDVSINQTGGTITNALVVNNSNSGAFAVVATNAGLNPTFDWRVNGSSVQVGTSTTYTNTSLVPGDVVTAILTPNLGGCSLTNYTSNSITINGPGATPTNWTGGTDSNWYIASNWDNGIPNKFKSAVINSGTPNNLTLTASANVYDITIQPGATFTISGSNQLYVFRNFTNNGAFVPNTSRVNFIGCSNASVLSCSGTQTFYNITVNTSYGLTVASGTHQVSNNFTFTNGIVTQNATLLFLAGSSATGASNLSYVNGSVRKAGTTAFVFPIGSSSRFARIGIGAPSASTTYTAQYFNTPFGTYTNAAAPLPVFNNVSAREYWTLNQTVGSGNATVTLYWEDSQYSQINDCGTTDLRIARFNGTAWQNNNNSVSTTGACSLSSALAGTVSTTAVVTQFGPLTFGSLSNTVNPLPVELTSFMAAVTPNSVLLNWSTASELNNDFFELQRSATGEKFEKIATVKGAGTVRDRTDYQYEDVTPLYGKNYYRLRQVDFDGQDAYSNVVVADVSIVSASFSASVFPNPGRQDELKFMINTSDTSSPVRMRMFDQLGKNVIDETLSLQTSSEQFDLRLPNQVSAGMFTLIFEKGTQKQFIRLVIKE
jgi:hypothetical protein